MNLQPTQLKFRIATVLVAAVVCHGVNSFPATVAAQLNAHKSHREIPFKLVSRSSSASNELRSRAMGDEAFTEPFQTVAVAASEQGTIALANANRGDVVRAGDLLFELDMTVLEASKRLSQAKANSRARLKAAEIEYEAKSRRYEQLVELLADDAGSPEEVVRAKTEAEIAKQNIEEIIEGNEQQALETKRIEAQIERRRVRSPIDGVVVDVKRKPGEYVSSADPQLATVVQLDVLRVVFYLPTQRAVSINEGDTAKLLLTETDQAAIGVVEYVAPITDADSGRVRVEVLIQNFESKYRSGVRCRILETSPRVSMMNNRISARDSNLREIKIDPAISNLAAGRIAR